jgi:hypothetical protein
MNSRRNSLLPVFLMAFFIIVLSCSSAVWKNTKSINTLKAYQSFVIKYPNSKFSDSANLIITDLETILLAREKNQAWAYKEYMRKFPEGPFYEEAHQACDSLEFLDLKNATIQRYKDYLSFNRVNRFKSAAQFIYDSLLSIKARLNDSLLNIEREVYQAAVSQKEMKLLTKYLFEYPNGHYNNNVIKLIIDILLCKRDLVSLNSILYDLSPPFKHEDVYLLISYIAEFRNCDAYSLLVELLKNNYISGAKSWEIQELVCVETGEVTRFVDTVLELSDGRTTGIRSTYHGKIPKTVNECIKNKYQTIRTVYDSAIANQYYSLKNSIKVIEHDTRYYPIREAAQKALAFIVGKDLGPDYNLWYEWRVHICYDIANPIHSDKCDEYFESGKHD